MGGRQAIRKDYWKFVRYDVLNAGVFGQFFPLNEIFLPFAVGLNKFAMDSIK